MKQRDKITLLHPYRSALQDITAENKLGTAPDNEVEIYIRTANVKYFGSLGITRCAICLRSPTAIHVHRATATQ